MLNLLYRGVTIKQRLLRNAFFHWEKVYSYGSNGSKEFREQITEWLWICCNFISVNNWSWNTSWFESSKVYEKMACSYCVRQFSFEIWSIFSRLFAQHLWRQRHFVWLMVWLRLVVSSSLIRFEVLGVTQGDNWDQCFFLHGTVCKNNNLI